jgi:ribosome-associated protein
VTIPASELLERFSRSSGPGGQSVNTTDSRVELRLDIAGSVAFTEVQRERLLQALAGRLSGGVLTIIASEHRSQWQNRTAARERLVDHLRTGLQPPPASRRATRPSRAARQRRLDHKKQRGAIKSGRGRVRDTD